MDLGILHPAAASVDPPPVHSSFMWARIKFGDRALREVAQHDEAAMKAAVLIALSAVTVIVGSTLALMNNACKSTQHSWCAPMSSVRHYTRHS